MLGVAQSHIVPMLYGALPHASAEDACAVLMQHQLPSIAWPQLPQRHFYERSIVQASWGFPGLVLDEAQRRVYVVRDHALAALPAYTVAFIQNQQDRSVEWTSREAAGLFQLLEACATGTTAGALKGQLLGPISLAAQLTDEAQQPLLADPVLFEGMVIHCCMRARKQAEALIRANRPALICIEEPFSGVMRSPFMTIDRDELVVALARVLLAIPCSRGLTLRCGTPLRDFIGLPLDVLLITHWDDALLSSDDIAVLCDCISRGIRVGVGIISVQGTTDDEGTRSFMAVYAIIERFLQAGVTPSQLRSSIVVAPAHSLGQVSIAEAEAVIAVTIACAAAVDTRLAHLIESSSVTDMKE